MLHRATTLAVPARRARVTAMRHWPGAHRCYSTQAGAPLRKKVTTTEVARKFRRSERIAMCTAYDYPSALHVDRSGMDIILVGDSLAMVQLGHDTTLPVDMETMLVHAKAVARAANSSLLVGDMPFGSYEVCPKEAARNAVRYLKEGGMDAVKLEGASEGRVAATRAIVDAGISVMGHIGLTPQSISVLGGFRAQGKTARAARQLLAQAQALQDAGCFALVIECVPEEVTAWITRQLRIPTIGIGSGAGASGQVLVYHDLVGMLAHPHHAAVSPSFCKQYAQVGPIVQQALEQYREEVAAGTFPSAEYSPYKMSAKQAALFAEEIAAEGGAGGDGTGAEAGEEDDAGADQGEAESPYGKPQQ